MAAHRLAVVLVWMAACNRPAEAEAEVKAEAEAKDAAPEPTPESCARLGDVYCERAPVQCSAATALFTQAQLSDAVCTAAAAGLKGIRETAPPELRALAETEWLLRTLERSPRLSKDQLTALREQAEAASAASFRQPAQLQCPGVSRPQGSAPPGGTQIWCAKDDGTRHGPSRTFNAQGELVQGTEYVDGEIAWVEYWMPASGEMDRALFVCPSGATPREEKHESLDVLSCVRADGNLAGSQLLWKGGRLVSIEAADPSAARFSGYMETE